MVDAHPARGLVKKLVDRGHNPETIASMLNHRVSARTVYRWYRGDSDPQNPTTLAMLRKVVDAVTTAQEAPAAS